MQQNSKVLSIHHMPASGGTIFSKSIAGMKNVVAISEIHPTESNDRRSMIFQYWRGYNKNLFQIHKEPIEQIFLEKVKLILTSIDDKQTLLLRDHIHADFRLHGSYKSSMKKILHENFFNISIATIRDPIETWISMRDHRWTHLRPDAFCKLYLEFLADFNEQQIFKYEDLVACPDKTLEKICDYFSIEFSQDYAHQIETFKHFTGNSGRKGNIIKERKKKPISAKDLAEFNNSMYYKMFCSKYDYKFRKSNLFEKLVVRNRQVY